MNSFTYTVASNPLSLGRTISKSQSLTGTQKVTFALSGLQPYDADTQKRINKIIVDFDDGTTDDLVINRPHSGTEIQTLSTHTFEHVLETDITDAFNRHVYFSVFRDDTHVDVIDVKFTMYKAPLSTYKDVNLLKTDYFNNNTDDEKLLLTFVNQNPEVLGLSLLDIDIDAANAFNPSISGSQHENKNSFNVGFTTEYIQTNASVSNTGNNVQIELTDLIDTNTGAVKNNGRINLKYRTRAATAATGAVNLPSNPELFYIPLAPTSAFFHMSGALTWTCGDLLKDLDLSTKTITIPLVDIKGTRTNLTDYYFTHFVPGVGTSTQTLSAGNFYVDLYDVSSFDTVTTTTSTITAFVNY